MSTFAYRCAIDLNTIYKSLFVNILPTTFIMKGKKVLHVINISFVINHFFGNQFTYFAKKGYEFTIACSEDEHLYKEARLKGFKVFPIPILRSIAPIQDLISIIKLAKYIKSEKFDLVIAHSPKGGLIGILAAYLAGVKKRVFFRHGVVFETSSGFKKRLLIVIEKIIGIFATDVVNVSESLEKLSNQYRLNKAEKNILLGKGTCNGIDLNRFQYRPKLNTEFVLGYVGRLSRDKGIIELVEGWLQFSSGKENVFLHLVGPLDPRDILPEDIIYKIRNTESIIYFDLVEDTSSYYNEMDVFILPSYREGFGMVVLEASACGLPVITTRSTGCINAIVENLTGIYTKINPLDIALAINYYFENPNLRKQYGSEGIQFVKEYFSEQKLFDEIEKKVLN
jgi:glycosyltransferase involved in cell wall biosynthesis